MSLSLALGIVSVVNLALGYALALVVEKHERDEHERSSGTTLIEERNVVAPDRSTLSQIDAAVNGEIHPEPSPITTAAPAFAEVEPEREPVAAHPAEPAAVDIADVAYENLLQETANLGKELKATRTDLSSEPRATLTEASELEAAILRWWENDPERTRPICVGQIEIDNLRQLTAEHGASAVGGLARQIERLVLCRLRRDDLVASLGRSRFLVMFPNVEAELAAGLLEELRSEVNGTEFTAENRAFRTTLTCAVAQAASNESVESLLAQAASALREASTAGRNRVAVHDGKKLSLLAV